MVDGAAEIYYENLIRTRVYEISYDIAKARSLDQFEIKLTKFLPLHGILH